MKVIDDKIDFDTLKKIMPPDAHHIRDMHYYSERVKEHMFNPQTAHVDELPWDKAKGLFDLRPGELTIWAGVNGHGKSMVTTQVALFGAIKSKWCIASMEMSPEATISRLVRMGAGTMAVTKKAFDEVEALVGDNIFIYDRQDTVDYAHMIKVVKYVRFVHGVKHMVIDSLMKCDKRGANKEQKVAAQVDFINDLATLARDTGIHIHLIHHMRKGEKESNVPDKFDVRGAGEIVDMADNLVIVHSDKRERSPEEQMKPDRTLLIAKQRHGEYEGGLSFWQSSAMQWVETPNRIAKCILPPPLPRYGFSDTFSQ